MKSIEKSASITIENPNEKISDISYAPERECISLKPFTSLKFPSHLTKIEELVQMLTRIIFTGSVLNSAVNSISFEYSTFAPNNPACMRGHLPTEKDRGKIDMKKILDSLPDQRLSAIQAGVAHTMSNMSGKPVYLTQISPRWMFTEPHVTERYHSFVAHLLKIEKKITERNKMLAIPYTALIPSTIPYGIGI